MPGTVGRGHGIGVDGAVPMPAPPEVALAVGDDVHAAGLDAVEVLGDVVPLPAVPLGPVALGPAPADVGDAPPPPALALALDAPASANAAKLGSIRWTTRKVSFVGLRG